MTDDRFRNSIQALRDELDQVEQPDRAALWRRIQPQLPAKHRRMPAPAFLYGVAATVLFLLIAGWWVVYGNYSEAAQLHAKLPAARRPELDRHFRLLQQKEQELQLTQLDRTAYRQWFAELATLDSLHGEYSADFNSLPKDDRTADLVLQHYEQKIRILELFSKEIQLQQHEKERIAWNRN